MSSIDDRNTAITRDPYAGQQHPQQPPYQQQQPPYYSPETNVTEAVPRVARE